MRFTTLTCCSLVLILAGCAEGPVKPDPGQVAAARDQYLLEVEPADPITSIDWREAQESPAPDAGSEEAAIDLTPVAATDPDDNRVTLVGKVGGMPSPFDASVEEEFPFRSGQAVFFLIDPATAAEFESHAEEAGSDHAADCPFCAREAAGKTDAVAVIAFAGEDGQPVAIDSRELFDLSVGDVVVVRGTPSLEGGLLTVQADGLFRRE